MDEDTSQDQVFQWPPEFYEQHWQNMPSYKQDDNGAQRTIQINFENQEAVKAFAKLVDQTITDKTKSIWFPKREKNNVSDLFWFSDEQ